MSESTSSDSHDCEATAQVSPSGQVHIDDLLRLAVRTQASDVHLKVGRLPVLRIHGSLVPVKEYDPLGPDDLERLYRQVTNAEQRASFEREKELDLAYELAGAARFRVNVGRQRHTITMVTRRLAMTIPTIDELGLPPVCKELIERPRG